MEQIPEEIAAFTAWLLARGPVHHVVEIGVRRGGTARHWHSISTGTVVGVDWFGKDSLGAKETIRVADELSRELPRYVAEFGNSQLESTQADVDDDLYGPADLVFLDGDHSYEGVRRDFDLYRSLTRSGSVIAFHDIVESELMHQAGHGVYRFWRELKAAHPGQWHEFIHDPAQSWGGIGALEVV